MLRAGAVPAEGVQRHTDRLFIRRHCIPNYLEMLPFLDVTSRARLPTLHGDVKVTAFPTVMHTHGRSAQHVKQHDS